jgi:3-oxoacyl-[acyl-carrier protein] reductase
MSGHPPNSSLPLAGRTAIVTGSGRNIGSAIALALAAHGANVVINGHSDAAALEQVAEKIAAGRGKAMTFLADVKDPAAVSQMVKAAEAAFGKVDIAISNVSLRSHRPLLETTDDEWNTVLATNLSSAFYLTRACLPFMVAQTWGRVINISGRDGFFPAPARVANVVSKGGVHALTKAVAVEFGRHGVTANTVAPGIVDTTRDLKNYPRSEELFAARLRATAVGRWGTVDDIAAAVLYLCLPSGDFVTGQVLHVSGGEFMQ